MTKTISFRSQLFKEYGFPNNRRSYFELSISLLFYVITLILVMASSHWLASIISIPLFSLALIRLFIIQHDCGHHSFFKKIRVNNTVGRLISLLTNIPYDYWRKSHSFHHTHSGIDGLFQAGGILILSVEEYENASLLGKITYRLFRQGLILLLLIGPFVLLVYYRLPLKHKNDPPKSIKLSDYLVMQLNNLFFLFILGGAFYLLNPFAALKILIALYIGAVIAFALFYIQHNFDSAYFVDKEHWSFEDAAIKGSSFLEVSAPLRWVTASIGYHHVHHLCPRIPFYKLKKTHERHKKLFHSTTTVKIYKFPHLLSLKLYDKEQQKMITWKEYSRIKIHGSKI